MHTQRTIDLRMNALAMCGDGPCGKCVELIVNPATGQVTHLVIEEGQTPHTERLVPIEEVAGATAHLIRLRCTTDQLARMDEFIEEQVVHITAPPPPYTIMGGDYGMWLPTFPAVEDVNVPHERVPAGELGLHREAEVRALDGAVGRVDELVVDPQGGHITHLVLSEGHLWNRRDVAIPVAAITRIEDDTVYLNLSKRQIEELPTTPAQTDR